MVMELGVDCLSVEGEEFGCSKWVGVFFFLFFFLSLLFLSFSLSGGIQDADFTSLDQCEGSSDRFSRRKEVRGGNTRRKFLRLGVWQCLFP